MGWTRLSLPKEILWGSRISEDASYVIRRPNREIYIVVDAHGAGASNIRKQLFASTAAKWLAYEIDKDPTYLKLSGHFQTVSQRLDASFDTVNVGAVATAVLITDGFVAIAWIGDVTAAYGGYRIGVETLTQGHTVVHPQERERLRPVFAQGEFAPYSNRTNHIGYDGPNRGLRNLRLGKIDRPCDGIVSCLQSLAITRAFGDSRYRPALISQPDVIIRPRSSFSPGGILCVYTDGAIGHLPKVLKGNADRNLTLDQLKQQYLRRAPRYDDTEILFIQL